MILMGTAIILATTLYVGSPAEAHVPPKCGHLFIEAGKETEAFVRMGNRVKAVVFEGLDRRRFNFDDYEELADIVSQLLGAATVQLEAIAKAIQCVHPR